MSLSWAAGPSLPRSPLHLKSWGVADREGERHGDVPGAAARQPSPRRLRAPAPHDRGSTGVPCAGILAREGISQVFDYYGQMSGRSLIDCRRPFEGAAYDEDRGS